MTHSILLAVKRPDEQDRTGIQEYEDTVRLLAGIARENKDTRLLGEGVILIPLHNELKDVAYVVNSIQYVPYIYTVLTEELHWYDIARKT